MMVHTHTQLSSHVQGMVCCQSKYKINHCSKCIWICRCPICLAHTSTYLVVDLCTEAGMKGRDKWLHPREQSQRVELATCGTEVCMKDRASNHIPQILWGVITCPCPWYLRLTHTQIRYEGQRRVITSHRNCKVWLLDTCFWHTSPQKLD